MLDRNFNLYHESFERLAGHQHVAQLYRRVFRLLQAYSTKLPFGEASLKLFYQCILCLQTIVPTNF